MQEKVKSQPRRRFWLFAILLFFSLSAYSAYAFSPRFIAGLTRWWSNDPFTPLCNLPNYALELRNEYYGVNNLIYPINPNPELRPFARGGGLSPDARWIYEIDNNLLFILDAHSNRMRYNYGLGENYQTVAWLYDSRLIFVDFAGSGQIYDPITGSIESFSQSLHSIELLSHSPLTGNDYFLAREIILENDGLSTRYELVIYEKSLNRRVLHSDTHYLIQDVFYNAQFSPDGRFLVINYFFDHPQRWPSYKELWLFDLQADETQRIRVVERITTNVHWSPDSRYLAYSIDNYEPSYDRYLFFYDVISRQVSLVYESPADYIKMLEWNEDGFWLDEVDISRNYVHILSLGNFDGVNLQTSPIAEGSFRNIHPINDSDNLILNQIVSTEPSISEMLILNPKGEFTTINDHFYYFEEALGQSPDNRYVAYTASDNAWVYVLDLESLRECKVIKLEGTQPSHYFWYRLP